MLTLPPVTAEKRAPGDGPQALNRRRALAMLSSWAGLAASGCSDPPAEIVPYVTMPERLVPGEPLLFATALPLAGYGRGVLGICYDGRPVKIEGNPRHPYSLGATDAFAEAEVLSLYDPDRSRAPLHDRVLSSWREFSEAWRAHAAASAAGTSGVLLTGRVTSPTLLRMIGLLKARHPALRHIRYEVLNDDARRQGARLAFGRVVEAVPRLSEASAILALDADPLGPGPSLLSQARGFAERRRLKPPQRLYVVEPGWTQSGASADYRLAMRSERVVEIARAIASFLGLDLGSAELSDEERRFAQAAAADLMSGRGLILAGERQGADVHAFCHWANARSNAPIDLLPATDPEDSDHGAAFTGFLRELAAGRIRTLIILDKNPVYDAADSDGAAAMIAAVPFSVHCGPLCDETAEHCHWHLPLSHVLESWGDIKSPDGTAALQQPLIRTLHDTRTAAEILSLLAGQSEASALALAQATWKPRIAQDFEAWWQGALTRGFIADSASRPLAVTAGAPASLARRKVDRFSLALSAHPSLWDGCYANNAWLQECPSPFLKEVWGNAIHLSPEDAHSLGLHHGQALTLGRGEAEVHTVVAVMDGHASGTATGFIGEGRWRAGAIGTGIGVRLRKLASPDLSLLLDNVVLGHGADGLVLRSTQEHTRLEGRDEELFPLAPADKIKERLARQPPTERGIVPAAMPGPYQWAMVIDNDLCIGCNACVVACQAENNVAVVGPAEIAAGRDMHWLRIDAYEIASPSAVRRGFQPVPCMHCETAPCEPVCPVEASVHDHEGLNVQVYNRCIGTRFCQSNCPYKVRRFNFFGYTRGQEYGNLGEPEIIALRNPNVSVRGRGVMEKCTYCVQRISRARRQAEKEDRPIQEGEVTTACQAACPTRAIRFGNGNRSDSAVAALRADERHYALLGHLDTRPRTTYLAKVFHANPELERPRT